MEIKRNDDGNGVIMTVTHKCGHVGSYFYGGEEFAKKDAGNKEKDVCINCFNSQQIEIK